MAIFAISFLMFDRTSLTLNPVRHLYIHVPFCSGKCAFCGFYSVVANPERVNRYLNALERELKMIRDEEWKIECDTIYVGGGSPSVLTHSQWARLSELLQGVIGNPVKEWTVEINPGTLSLELLQQLAVSGVNRVSIGAQSFDDSVLASMNRRHTAADSAEAVVAVRKAGIENVGLDLIAGLPGVDDYGWQKTLKQALALKPDHLSVYALSLEPQTELWGRVQRGECWLPDDENVLMALRQAERLLSASGTHRYEISNFARPGRECLHNLACWKGEDYLGLGPSAASRVGLSRWRNRPNLNDYCDSLELGKSPPRHEAEQLDVRTDLIERLLFRFRLTEGVKVGTLCRAAGETGENVWQAWYPELAQLSQDGLLTEESGCWKTTDRGREVLDAVLERLAE